MVDIIIWMLIIASFILSFVGIIYPIIPSPLVLWIGFFLYYFTFNSDFNWIFWTSMAVLTIILIVSDVFANGYFVKRYGGSKWGERAAGVAVIVGSFIVPPFGILIVPFVVVILIELMQKRTGKEAIRAAIGSLFGFLGGVAAKVFIQLMMIIWFFVSLAIW
ncbi:hypothetical protein BN1058_02699 [Paraliobacillus sp. PM-2]|uniref:DUF456 domain-containing protein n=1 Tax=Paraliobacillus sp. PM-2 TaxID=1462524 RepID=UPI00061C0D81|nr:DUF456 domain-containing protein [Paraliobacillus sp. PM-2]CQR48332.1 hypothetical protein BN1058_02699 [Paraliobacillus sp. PM-2]